MRTIRIITSAAALTPFLINQSAQAGGTDRGEGRVSYRGQVEVVTSTPRKQARCEQRHEQGLPCLLRGRVFEDANRDSKAQQQERGVEGVMVSNGIDVVTTDPHGRYALPIREQEGGTTVFITKPAGYKVPVTNQNVPQFYYHHVPQGSPELRFGGLPASGPLPDAVNFPLLRTQDKKQFKIVVSGDPQPYSNNEVGYVRDTLAKEVADMDDIELVMVEGDVMGDDLGLFPRFKEIMSVTQTPLYLVGGNHDLDYDARSDAYSYDTFRREWGPAYYSFDIGDVHFVGLDNVRYPCTPEVDNADGLHSFCDDPVNAPTYNGRINQAQMEWLYNDLSHVPQDKLVVLNMHIPLVTYIDQYATKHQTDNVKEVYDLLEGRKALAFSGHTHTLEQIRPGDVYEGWNETFADAVGPSPFPQIVSGAACGSWWSGDFDVFSNVPTSTQRLGAPRGFLVIEFNGNEYQDTFKATGQAAEKQMSVSFLSPTFQAWYEDLLGFLQTPVAERPDVVPVGINDLPDTSIITSDDLAGGVKLVANVWNGSGDSQVWAQFDTGELLRMTRSQQAAGEGKVEALDPWALERQLYTLRYAISSSSGDPRAQGFELFNASRFEGEPQPLEEGMLTVNSTHLWTVELPVGLDTGAHLVRIITVDAHGRDFEEMVAFEVMDERPPPFFRSEVFE